MVSSVVAGASTRGGFETVTDPTVGFRRTASAVALSIGVAFQVVCNTAYAVVTTSGGSDETGADTLALYGAHPTEARVAVFFAMAGSMLIVAGVPALLRVLRAGAPRLSLVGGVLLGAGYMAYLGIVSATGLEVALATGGVDAADALDASMADPLMLPFFLLFVAGNLIGTLLVGLAVIRRGGAPADVPRAAGALIIAWPVLHVTGLLVGSEWFEVTGGVLETAGLLFLTFAAARMNRQEWVRRG